MIAALTRPLNAPSLAWRGIISVIFGVVALAWPGVTLVALTFLYGAYAMADGVFALIVAAQAKHRHRWLLLIDGLLGVALGVLTVFWPAITLLVLIFMIGARFLVMGGLQIGTAIALRNEVPMPFLYGLGGGASLLLGLFAFVLPGMTAFALVMLLAAYALLFGFAFLALAVVVWRSSHTPRGGGSPATAGAR